MILAGAQQLERLTVGAPLRNTEAVVAPAAAGQARPLPPEREMTTRARSLLFLRGVPKRDKVILNEADVIPGFHQDVDGGKYLAAKNARRIG